MIVCDKCHEDVRHSVIRAITFVAKVTMTLEKVSSDQISFSTKVRAMFDKVVVKLEFHSNGREKG